MKLRKLQEKDAEFMLEWMRDDSVVHYLKKSFFGMTIADCIEFIQKAQDEKTDIHFAIVDDSDEYMGTVSLKNIGQESAELGLVLRACAWGKGYALFGMNAAIDYVFSQRGITDIYWCVDPENQRAVSFYEKSNCKRCNAPTGDSSYTDCEKQRYLWYCTKR